MRFAYLLGVIKGYVSQAYLERRKYRISHKTMKLEGRGRGHPPIDAGGAVGPKKLSPIPCCPAEGLLDGHCRGEEVKERDLFGHASSSTE